MVDEFHGQQISDMNIWAVLKMGLEVQFAAQNRPPSSSRNVSKQHWVLRLEPGTALEGFGSCFVSTILSLAQSTMPPLILSRYQEPSVNSILHISGLR